MSISGSCHCGAVTYEFNDKPEWTTECNCSICRRLGTQWIYSDIENITITAQADATLQYNHGDKTLAFHSCKTCGCTTHWEDIQEKSSGKMAVNLRLTDPSVAATIPIRHFDGADTWKFLD